MFSLVADLTKWLLKKQYDVSFLLHSLDDFYTPDPPNWYSQRCHLNLATCIQQFQDWEIPLHPDKLEGPCNFLTVSGIDLDPLLLQARLPQGKFDRINAIFNMHAKSSLLVTPSSNV